MTALNKSLDPKDEVSQWIQDCGATLHYQPIVHTDDQGRVQAIGMEALLRCRESGVTTTSCAPAEFLSGLNTVQRTRLVQWVIKRAIADVNSMPLRSFSLSDGRAVPLSYFSVNAEADAIASPGFIAMLHEAMQAVGGSALGVHLSLEFLENVSSLEIMDQLVQVRQGLYKKGISCAIDDFGEHFNGLAQVRALRPDTLKIGASYVRNIEENDPYHLALAQSITGLCRDVKINCVAEGVETLGQFRSLLTLGVRGFQGFLFSKAVPVDELASVLRKTMCWTPVDESPVKGLQNAS